MINRLLNHSNKILPTDSLEQRLLAVSALGLTILCALGIVVTSSLESSSTNVTIPATIAFFGLYVISFTQYYRGGVLVFSVSFIVLLYAGLLNTGNFSSDNVGNFLRWTILTVLLATIYLKTYQTTLLVSFNIVVLILLTHLVPDWNWLVTSRIGGFIVSTSIAVVIASHYRTEIEQSRLQLLQQQTEKLAHANQELEVLLHIVSHDLKEPLRAIESFSNVVETRYSAQLEEQAQNYLFRISRATQRLRDLLDNIMLLSRARSDTVETRAVNGQEIVQNAVERLEHLIEQKNVQLKVADNLPTLNLKPSWATEAVYNLLTNAIKFSRAEDPIEIEIDCYEGIKGVGLVVRDRGEGVPLENSERIFQLFKRNVGRNVPGTGAGLAIVQEVAKQHGGSTWVEPREGGGSNFHITFAAAVPIT